jgi:hypothetical protein
MKIKNKITIKIKQAKCPLLGLGPRLGRSKMAVVPRQSAIVGIECSMIGTSPSLVPRARSMMGMKRWLLRHERALEPDEPPLKRE